MLQHILVSNSLFCLKNSVLNNDYFHNLFLEEKYKIETEIVQVDFCDGQQIYSKIDSHIANKDIGMLGKLNYYY